MRLALYQPDIPQNCGTLIRLGAALGVSLDIIEPCGFLLDDKRLRRAHMDYIDLIDLTRHANWEAFCDTHKNARRVLLTTKGAMPLYDFQFQPDDILILGRESSGVPDAVHQAVTALIIVPMQPAARSLNVAITGAIALSEALRQINYK